MKLKSDAQSALRSMKDEEPDIWAATLRSRQG